MFRVVHCCWTVPGMEDATPASYKKMEDHFRILDAHDQIALVLCARPLLATRVTHSMVVPVPCSFWVHPGTLQTNKHTSVGLLHFEATLLMLLDKLITTTTKKKISSPRWHVGFFFKRGTLRPLHLSDAYGHIYK